jgi:SAM-dependent methyltransferase
VQQSPKDVVRAGYDAVSERYRGDHEAPPEYEPWLELVGGRLPREADVLDLGCGCGVPMTQRLTERGYRVLGVDVSRVQIERARTLVPSPPQTHARWWATSRGRERVAAQQQPARLDDLHVATSCPEQRSASEQPW